MTKLLCPGSTEIQKTVHAGKRVATRLLGRKLNKMGQKHTTPHRDPDTIAANSSESLFSRLPDELFQVVIGYLDDKSLAMVGASSMYLRRVVPPVALIKLHGKYVLLPFHFSRILSHSTVNCSFVPLNNLARSLIKASPTSHPC